MDEMGPQTSTGVTGLTRLKRREQFLPWDEQEKRKSISPGLFLKEEILGQAATWVIGFVNNFLKVLIACLGNMQLWNS